MVDLDEATRIGQEIIDIITNPQDHSDQILHILVRASALGHEYLRTAVAKDLEGPIRIRQEATNATDQDSFGQALHLYHDTDEFDKMYRTIEAAVDLEDSQAYLEEGIQIAREMSDLIPQDHPARAMFLYSLGVQLRIKYSITGAVADLDRVIQIRRELVNTTPLHRLERVEYLHDLGVQFEDRYLVLQMETDLEQAIQIIRQAVDEAPTDYLNRARFLNSLGKLIGEKHSRTHAIADLEDSISCHRSALHQLNSPIMTRIVAGREILENCALIPDWQQAYEAADIAVHLIPKLLSQSLENSDRQKVLGQLNCLASDAAAVALSARKGPLAALEFLEQGRSVLAAHLEGMHTGTLNLRKDHPGLAEEFICLQNDLEIPKDRESSCKDDASWRSKKHDELDSLNDEIREQAGYENFWLAQNITRMRVAASYGPIVLINVSDYRCDAILIEQHQIRSIYLPNLSSTDVTEKSDRDDPGSPNILEWLWNTITNPILDALGFTQPPCHENWPRVWWITTGLLSKFPLHASGRHSKDSTETVLDRVISSYSSSVRAIIQSRSHRDPEVTLPASAHVLLVAMKHTPGYPDLHFAPQEIAVIHNLCKSMALNPLEPGRRKQDVVSHLPQSKIFHFAGHGSNGADYDPLNSSLILEDGESDPLMVATLLEMNLRKHTPFLAYLSACGTGQNRDHRMVDENTHLISGFQVAGFRHVIGTLWKVNDELCADMARITYEGIKDGGMTDESVARGLHNAARELRRRWLCMPAKASLVQDKPETPSSSGRDQRDDGLLREFDVSDDEDGGEGERSLPWVPYVHFGV